MLIHGYHPRVGGAERQLAALIPFLSSEDVMVDVVTRQHPGLSSYDEIDGVPVYRLPVPGPKVIASLSFTIAALNLLRKLEPDIIHAHEIFSTTTTAVTAKRLLGQPIVATLHGGGAYNEIVRLKKKFLGKYRLKTFKKAVDSFVVISNELDAELKAVGVSERRRSFIPNGVDTDYFKPLSKNEKFPLRSELGLPNSFLVIFTGRLAPEKRLDDLISIWPVIRAKYPDACLLILGTGSEMPRLKKKAGTGIIFKGVVNTVLPYLQAADIFVLPSEREGLSVALLEAMSVGLPVLATNVGGTPDVVTHNDSGWLVPYGEPHQLQDGLDKLLIDSDLRKQLGTRARERVVNEYSLPVVAKRLAGLYQDLVLMH